MEMDLSLRSSEAIPYRALLFANKTNETYKTREIQKLTYFIIEWKTLFSVCF